MSSRIKKFVIRQ